MGGKKSKKTKERSSDGPNEQCLDCQAQCCRYFALPIDAPEDMGDFDDIRWYLLHEGVSVFVDEGDWYIQINSRCTALRDDHLCGIYEDRPKICRKYKSKDCEFAEPEGEHELLLETPQQCIEYAEKTLGKKFFKRDRRKSGKGKKKRK